MMFEYHKDGTLPTQGEIFVFGSNKAGRHGKGAALVASQKYGAVYGIGSGETGQCYGIPTKDEKLEVLSLDEIKSYVDLFIERASHPFNTRKYFVTRVGCGLAGYNDADIAPLFRNAPYSCMSFPREWARYLENQNNDA